MSNIIAFPEAPKLPNIESFPIYMDMDTKEIHMPFIPDTQEDAASVLGNFMVILLGDGILSEDDILQVALQATGKL